MTKNTHITHIEDLLFEDPNWNNSYNYLKQFYNFLAGSGTLPENISRKWDGARHPRRPNPENGKFFVSTKSFFTKNPKINYTPEDILSNHFNSQGLCDKLNYLLEYLPQLEGIFDNHEIIQGDLMYTPESKIMESDTVSFKPNTLKYRVDLPSHLGNKIAESKIGIVIHTKYYHDKYGEWQCLPLYPDNIKYSNRDTCIFSTKIQDLCGCFVGNTKWRNSLNFLSQYVNGLNWKVLEFFSEQKNRRELLYRYLNYSNYNGLSYNCPGFIKFLENKFTSRVSKDIISFVKQYSAQLLNIFDIYKLIQSYKNALLTIAQQHETAISDTRIFLPNGQRTGHEGYVMQTYNNELIKFVNRSTFSYHNANNVAEWKTAE